MRDKTPSWWERTRRNLERWTTWLIPGLGVKRWLILILLGTTLIGIGLGVVILQVYRTAPETWWLPIMSAASLRFLPRLLRAIIFGGAGLLFIAIGIWELNRSLIKPFLRPGDRVADALLQHRQRERGPRIVAIGGGHGLAAILRGLKAHSHNITAVVTVADDGGSSGRLRRDLGILPPGDIRNCLAALADDEALLAQLFQYRFPAGETGLDGHSFGNLFITALTEVTGSFEDAVAESGRVLAVRGRVLPSTLHDVRLVADIMPPNAVSEVRIVGESQISLLNGRVRRVWLEPSSPPAYPAVVQAILNADLILIGPGSLYTSILPNLLVPDLADAVRASRAAKFFICNVATEVGETDGYTCGDHLRAIVEHAGSGLFDLAIANNVFEGTLPENVGWVTVEPDLHEDFRLYETDTADILHPWRHDSQKLARAVIELYQEKTGPLVQ